jgi:tRNA U54 and U55 pseudouridine synthase Pus10
VSLNIRSGQKKQSASQREADLLVLNNGKIYVIEVKADIPAHLEAKNIEAQISSLGDRFGEISKLIFLGPEAVDRLTKASKMDDFKLRCKSNNVTVCTSKDELLNNITR